MKNKYLEEKAKAKKQKLLTNKKFEETTYEIEMERILKELTANINEIAKPRLIKLLMPFFGLYDKTGMPKAGSKFMKVILFPNFLTRKF